MRGNKAKRMADLQHVENKNAHWAANNQYNFIRVQFPDGDEKGLLFTDKEIERALKRAEKNPEDLPKVSWIRNTFD